MPHPPDTVKYLLFLLTFDKIGNYNHLGEKCMDRTVFADDEKILFVGDSITDCYRAGGATQGLSPLGEGYVGLFADILRSSDPKLQVDLLNKGIGGNTIVDLTRRWENDVLSEKPDWVLVMIGINDIHRHLRGQEKGVSSEKFREKYDDLLSRTAGELDCRLVILDPFYMSRDGDNDPFRKRVLAVLGEYLSVTADMAVKYGALHLRTQDAFLLHLQYRTAEVFCQEPVHPNNKGHMVIAWELFKLLRVCPI